MAHIYKRKESPFWWIKYRDPNTGATRREGTGFKVNVTPDTRKAKELAAERSLDEVRTSRGGSEENWAAWVPGYLATRYAGSPPKTLSRYEDCWGNLTMFLDERKIASPRHLTRTHCFDYLTWRTKPAKNEGRYHASHNTALFELRMLKALIDEAILRGYTTTNPCAKLGIKKLPRREKPELTDADIEFIRSKFDAEPEPNRTFLRNSFEIARYQGCRLAETYLDPLENVEVFEEVKGGEISKSGRIHFHRKGGRLDTVPMHPALIPLFESLRAGGSRTTYEMPMNPSRKWWDFFKKIGMRKRLPGLCFHSLRVTAATRMARANVPEAKAMKYLSHASTVVHRTYQRLRTGDLGECFGALK
jgi:integrase